MKIERTGEVALCAGLGWELAEIWAGLEKDLVDVRLGWWHYDTWVLSEKVLFFNFIPTRK